MAVWKLFPYAVWKDLPINECGNCFPTMHWQWQCGKFCLLMMAVWKLLSNDGSAWKEKQRQSFSVGATFEGETGLKKEQV